MTSKHKNPSNSNPKQKDQEGEDEQIFDLKDHFEENQESPDDGDTDDKLKELESSLSESKEKHLRLLAEFDNYKKRTSRERYELFNTASKTVITAMLPVVDDFERAFKSMEGGPDESFSEGIKIIYHRLLQVLQSQGLKAMESTGEAFDPDLHEAITEVPVEDEDMRGRVVETIEKGYMLHDKIIRHAKVVVGKAE